MTEMASYVCTYFWVAFLYKYHGAIRVYMHGYTGSRAFKFEILNRKVVNVWGDLDNDNEILKEKKMYT